jgi:hypothetical protein
LLLLTFPDPVKLKRFAAPLCVLIFGIYFSPFLMITENYSHYSQFATFEKWLRRGSKSFSLEIRGCLNIFEINESAMGT